MRFSPWTISLTALPTYAFALILGVETLSPNSVAAIDDHRQTSCLDRFIDVVTIRNDFGFSQYTSDSQVGKIAFDAFGSIWRPESVDGEPAPSSINVTAGTKGCWAGGRVLGVQSNSPLGDIQGAAAAISVSGLHVRPIDFEFEWIEVSDVPHAIESLQRLKYLIIRTALIRELHGDCFNLNDEVGTLVIHDSLIDGCSYLVNDRSESFIKGDAQLLIRDSVIRLRAGRNEPSQSVIPLPIGSRPKVKVVDSVFLLDGPVPLVESLIAGTHATIDECRGNIVILGEGGAVIGPLPPCFRILKSQEVWASKKERWLETHRQQTDNNDPPLDQDADGTPNEDPNGTDGNSDADPGEEADPNPDEDADHETPTDGLGVEWSDGTLWNDNTGWL